ncbi:MAG: hypothetical protein V1792_00015 [Pseudomonadota bacterium]
MVEPAGGGPPEEMKFSRSGETVWESENVRETALNAGWFAEYRTGKAILSGSLGVRSWW